jgi:hypothetical protein
LAASLTKSTSFTPIQLFPFTLLGLLATSSHELCRLGQTMEE